MIEVVVKIGDLVDETADAIICPANPWLNMSGGINGELLLRGGESIQQELHAYLRFIGKPAVEPATVVVTGPGPLKAKHALHVVAIDPFYDSSVDLVYKAVRNALQRAIELSAITVAMPALATGYGHLTIAQFALAFVEVVQRDFFPVARLVVVLRKAEYSDILQTALIKRNKTRR
jgi:O-acetyl-ADP-ribose deacetylase